MIELCLLLTFMAFDCILLKLPWSFIDIQFSTQHGDRKEQHFPISSDLIVHMSVSPYLSCLMFDKCYHVVLTSSCCIHPLCEPSFTLWNTNLVVECARYFEKVSTFGLRLLCFTLFVEHNLLYWHCYCVCHVWWFMQDIHTYDCECHTLPMGFVHIW